MRVAALIQTSEGVVLVRHRAGDREYHLLPGGGVDYRETVGAALVREVREETGLEVKLGAPVLVSDTIDPKGSRHVINLVFEAEAVGGAITDTPLDDRVVAVDIVPAAALTDLDLRPPMAQQIQELLDAGVGDARARYLGSLFV